ncbi:unnamed protein product [Adineta ricciae]|uniref:Uncharacterized protein n=1 Tax=Adineta ricciae TaxID=249248 RepID=A0A814BQX0_ADIRI|nr:unnamed protein product [Adineta ricciae]
MMDSDFDDEDVRSLSERVLPISSTNQTSSSSRDTNQSVKLQANTICDNQSFQEILSKPGNIGDIIQLSDGTRKKFNGTTWRRMCSEPECSYYTQREGLCKPHLAALKKRKLSSFVKDNNDNDESINSCDNSTKPSQRICADPNCAKVIDESCHYQNGFCSHHYDEFCARNLAATDSSSDISILSTSLRKRRHPDPPSQVPVLYDDQPSISKTNHRLSIASIPPSVDINNPKKGDIIEMVNGSRKKFDGVIWRKICSVPGCLIASQRNELCRKHINKLDDNSNDVSSTDLVGLMAMMTSTSERMSSVSTRSSTDEKLGTPEDKCIKTISERIFLETRVLTSIKTELTDDADIEDECNTDNVPYSHPKSDADDDDMNQLNGHHQDKSSTMHEDHSDTSADHTSCSNSQKFSTNPLKKWLREHRNNPYPTNQEKIDLARQSSMTSEQVVVWLHNARSILRRSHPKSRHSSNTSKHNNHNELTSKADQHSCSNTKIAAEIYRSFPFYNETNSRSVGVQCNPSTTNQTTATEFALISDEELISDRTIKILTPSHHVLKAINSMRSTGTANLVVDNMKTENSEDIKKEREIILSSTCLDDDQMTRFNDFCARFHIKSSNIVDKYTTHLITDEEGETLVCPLSKKVIQGIAYHVHILTYRWLDDCLKLNQIINEKPYEIQGDLTLSPDHYGMQRSRQSILPYSLPETQLLEKYSIMLKCDGCQGMMNSDELIELVKLCGAKYTTDSHFSRLQPGNIRVVLCEKEYLASRKEVYEKCVQAGVHFVTPEWFLESLVQYCHYSPVESDDSSIELTKEQVKAALTSLVPIDKQSRTVASRKRRRKQSIEPEIEKPHKKHKPIYHDIVLSNMNQPETMVLAASGLTHHQMKHLKKFVLLFNCRLLLLEDQSTFNHTITHLITDEIGQIDSLICTLTKTVVFAIAQHSFILSHRWISECLKQNTIVSEEQYEIEGDHLFATKHNGPRRSRLSKRPLLPLNHFVMIKGDSHHYLEFTNAELGDLAWLAGGIYIEQNRFPNTVFSRQCFLLIEDEDIRNKNMFHRCIDKGLKFLRSEWLIRSIVEYRMADIVQYHCDPFDSIDRSE